MEIKQYHLKAPGQSGRGVRFRVLEPDQVLQAEDDAVAMAGERPTNVKYRNAFLTEALKQCVTEVTRDPVDPGKLAAARNWVKLSATDWHTGKVRQLLNAKDLNFLQQLYSQLHEVSPQELRLITGEAIPVVTEDDQPSTGTASAATG